jgi:hypothetical protein
LGFEQAEGVRKDGEDIGLFLVMLRKEQAERETQKKTQADSEMVRG